jgi:hypothetical protein
LCRWGLNAEEEEEEEEEELGKDTVQFFCKEGLTRVKQKQ